MTASELAAFHAGIWHAADMALASALMLEIRDDARQVRQRAAIAALRALAEGLKEGANGSAEPKGTHETRTPETAPAEAVIPASLSERRQAAVAAGYTGDPCPTCLSFTLKQSGTCLVCETCGSTTGCS